MTKQALLLLSGGIDSATLLAKLKSEGYRITALSFHYGQKHSVELNYAKELANKYEVKEHLILDIPNESFSGSALVNKTINPTKFNDYKNLPTEEVNSYVPFRNIIFLSFALSIAESRNIHEIFIAVNKEDAINYWDCSVEFIEKMNIISKMNTSISIESPFINLSKKEVVLLGKNLGVDFNQTISCYQPIDGVECGSCLSCIIKKEALNE